MIPSTIPAACKSEGEKEVFWRLRDDPDTRDWIVLHSLDIARHRSQIAGEIDFVVIIPRLGVICVEVKGCGHLRVSDGRWYYGSDPEGDPRGPFKQAAEAMYSLRAQLPSEFSGVPFWTAVIFPFTPFDRESVEWHTWQVIDTRALRALPISRLLSDVLRNARAHLRGSGRTGWFKPERNEPTPERAAELARRLRPEFEYFESPRARVRRREEEVERYTTEQYEALEGMDANDRAVFHGPAGTGKTVLALAAAERAHAAGRETLFLCYNRLLGAWLREQTAQLAPLVTTRTLNGHTLRVAGHEPSEEEAEDANFWRRELPRMATDALLREIGTQHVFEELIVDEAQDLLEPEYLDFLDLSLRGGLAAGRWRLFGDFEKQAIYSRSGLTLSDLLATRGGHAAQFSLRRNCRNTPRVADLARALGGLNPFYSKVLRPDDGVDPEPRFHGTAEVQRCHLIEALDQLSGEGFSSQNIIVLSPLGDARCAASQVTGPWRDRLRPYRAARRDQVRYCTIQAFKGMEAPAVVLTDITSVDDDSRPLFYVAVTRPLQRLVVLVDNATRRDITRALFGQ